ncbi:hypothetical protein SAMN04487983_100572 [Streptomyces sp. yr375]|nr:hypothetical protein SAMN04487983_100572 [Streptomyces sp. yr375]
MAIPECAQRFRWGTSGRYVCHSEAVAGVPARVQSRATAYFCTGAPDGLDAVGRAARGQALAIGASTASVRSARVVGDSSSSRPLLPAETQIVA